ncbi:MAG: YdbH domain-containing protein [Sphingomicrobium sp.]
MVVRRSSWGRLLVLGSLAVLAVLLVLIIGLYIQRRSLADHFLRNELERRGVTATYRLDRVGFRSQIVRNLVLGDPAHPDLTAKYAELQTRLKWDGSFEVYRIVARGVRLRGQLAKDGKVHFGQIDKLLPPPSNKPFKLPDFALDVADATIALRTPFGPVGIALAGAGNLSGGFKGRAVVRSPHIVPGRCQATNLAANLAVSVVGRRPIVDGPVALDRVACPASRFVVVEPRFDTHASFNESFSTVDGQARMAIRDLVAGANALALFTGDLSFKGPLDDIRGKVKLAAQRSRLATIFADRTRIDAAYTLNTASGRMTLAGRFGADSAILDEPLYGAIAKPLAAAAKTPVGPVASAIARAITRTATNFDIDGEIRMVNLAGGGAVRINNAEIAGPDGATARIAGGTGVTYYWPAGNMRIDTVIATGGGGLPTGRIELSQAKAGAPMSGVATFSPYVAGGSRLVLTPVRFSAAADGTTRISTVAQIDGRFPEGQVQALRLPIDGLLGRGGSFAFGTSCAVLSWDAARFGALSLNRTRLPVCPVGPAIVTKGAGGRIIANARLGATHLDGRLGRSPFQLDAASARFAGDRFTLDRLRARLGKSESPVRFDAARLDGTFAGRGINGTFAGAEAVIGRVPLLLSQASGAWRTYHGDITVDARAMVSDRFANPRFYPLKTNDLHLTIADNRVRANGTVLHPATGKRVMAVDLEHLLATGTGYANLEVASLAFGPGFQPDDLTRLTEGVVALVNGTISGTGRVNWSGNGKVTSTGDFSTAGLDLAAPFGPITGIKGTIHFSDLLGLTTAPGQTLSLGTVNPGILVGDGTIRYQLLPGQLVKVERGEWPFMGGRLVLHETVINLGRPSAKRLTFEVIGLDAHTFVSSFGFKELDATGTFDGVLPMIFDDNGGRIVGGRLDSRPGGGSLAYNGVVNKANLGMMGNIAFNALRDLRFKSMIIRLDGDLAGEVAARLQIEGVGLGQTKTQKLIRGLLAKIPLKMNVKITGPFRALIATAKSFGDPRRVIADVLPVPLDGIPGVVTEIRRVEQQQTQTQTPPAPVEVTTTTTPTQ